MTEQEEQEIRNLLRRRSPLLIAEGEMLIAEIDRLRELVATASTGERLS